MHSIYIQCALFSFHYQEVLKFDYITYIMDYKYYFLQYIIVFDIFLDL